jgi:hypothetical protein
VTGVRPGGPAGSAEMAPCGFVPEGELGGVVAGALAGVGLGVRGRRIAGWLAGWDRCTVLAVVSWIARGAGGRAGAAGGTGVREGGFCPRGDITCSIFMSCLGVAVRVLPSMRGMSTRLPGCSNRGLPRRKRPGCWPGGWAARNGRRAVMSARRRSRAGSGSRKKTRSSLSGFPCGSPQRPGSMRARRDGRSPRSSRRRWKNFSAGAAGTIRAGERAAGGDRVCLQPSWCRGNVSGLRHIGAAAAGQDRQARPGRTAR